MFNKYTETGAKAGQEDSASATDDQPLPDIVKKTDSLQVDEQTLPNATVQFPDINQNGDMNGFHSDDEETVDSLNRDSDHENYQDRQTNDDRMFDLTRLKTKYAEVNFRHLQVSPVQTPHVKRPMTREQTRLSVDDKIHRILNGHVHVSCPTRNKTIRMYLCSGFTGKM